MPLPLLLDLSAAFVAAFVAMLAWGWASASPAVPDRPALEPARAAGEAIRTHGRLRALATRRLDRSVATGLLLTLALAVALAAGVVLGVLAYLVRSQPELRRIDKSVAAWGFDHRTPLSTHALHVITDLGSPQVVLVLALAVAVIDLVRTRDRWCAPFLIVTLAGMELITTGVKDLVGKGRPAFVPAAASLGPSFPSGHSATSAAFYAAAALILGRRLGRGGRRLLAAVAVAFAVAVAGSRVLLDLHWLSDVVGGLAVGWGWFALCAAIFGGRMLRPTAAVDEAATTARRGGLPRGMSPV